MLSSLFDSSNGRKAFAKRGKDVFARFVENKKDLEKKSDFKALSQEQLHPQRWVNLISKRISFHV